ncbi:MAG: GGDEF domain-containing protein [Herpetosiphonaceae bacterium]|nr:GGDEF domain-containing protein [Herpetosiphonaceae bacterium]
MMISPRNANPVPFYTTARGRWLLVGGSIVLITLMSWIIHEQAAIELLYLFPILLAAVAAEWQGGVAIAAVVTVLNLLLDAPITMQKMLRNGFFEIVIFWGIGLFCGLLVSERNRYLVAAHTDQLTGLGNRTLWERTLAHELERTKRFGQPFSIALCDLDHFKQVNDRYGHGVGDQVLKLWTETLRREARTIDIVCRIGGEEIAILLPNADGYNASAACVRWCKAVATSKTPGGSITMSVGVASYDPSMSLPELMGQADMALYAAKEGGRNQVVLTTDGMQLVC